MRNTGLSSSIGLVALGAGQLYISQRTVDAHLSHIRRKLGVTDRSKIVVIARTHFSESAS